MARARPEGGVHAPQTRLLFPHHVPGVASSSNPSNSRTPGSIGTHWRSPFECHTTEAFPMTSPTDALALYVLNAYWCFTIVKTSIVSNPLASFSLVETLQPSRYISNWVLLTVPFAFLGSQSGFLWPLENILWTHQRNLRWSLLQSVLLGCYHVFQTSPKY